MRNEGESQRSKTLDTKETKPLERNVAGKGWHPKCAEAPVMPRRLDRLELGRQHLGRAREMALSCPLAFEH